MIKLKYPLLTSVSQSISYPGLGSDIPKYVEKTPDRFDSFKNSNDNYSLKIAASYILNNQKGAWREMPNHKGKIPAHVKPVFDGSVCLINGNKSYETAGHTAQPGQRGFVYNTSNEIIGKGQFIMNPDEEWRRSGRPLLFNITHTLDGLKPEFLITNA